jgi:arabinogalactan oligomer/maltooligosaccharide transport system permease protein
MLIDGVLTLAVVAIFIAVYIISVRGTMSAWDDFVKTGRRKKSHVIGDLAGTKFHLAALTPAVLMIAFFVIIPLVFSVLIAFTNYSSNYYAVDGSVSHHIPPQNTIDWVGLENFSAMFGGKKTWGDSLGGTAVWTLIWGALATFTCYFGGTVLAVVMHENKIKLLPAFSTIFILPYAVPSVVSMLIWQNLLNGSFGPINRTLQALGILAQGQVIPWLSDAWLARFTCILINFWAGVPYFMLLVTGTLTSISQDVLEAASIDGANKFQVFRKITLPMVLYQTMPLIIMSFTFNINNFGAIFFLTGGNPAIPSTTATSAGGTDILGTWIYKLTVNLQQYNYASVLAVIICVVLAPFAIFNFRRTKSYKEGTV